MAEEEDGGTGSGGRVVHYTERFQARQAAIQVLPGAIPLDEVRPVDTGLVGRCPVCGLQVAG